MDTVLYNKGRRTTTTTTTTTRTMMKKQWRTKERLALGSLPHSSMKNAKKFRLVVFLTIFFLYGCEAFSTFTWWSNHLSRHSRGRQAAVPPVPLLALQLTENGIATIDPLLVRILRETINKNDINDSTVSSIPPSRNFQHLGGTLIQVSNGLQVWRSALLKGCLPYDDDDDEYKNDDMDQTRTVLTCWPPKPLYDRLVRDTMVPLQIPRLVYRHPEVVPLILMSLLRWTMEYSRRLDDVLNDEVTKQNDDDDDEDEEEEEYEDFFFSQWQEQYQADLEQDTMDDGIPALILTEDADSIARDIAKSFQEQWSGVVNGVGILDGLFGMDHGLLNVEDDETPGSGGDGATTGYGWQDGIWSHSGWEEIPKLQQELTNLPELSQLIQSLGRRPTAENWNSWHKFVPRRPHREGGLGADFDPQRRESIDGITLSNSLSEMLPSEALLLCGNSTGSGGEMLRRLFLAKKVESKLLSYQLSGWTDIPSIPKTKSRYRTRFPSAPGGPIIICLDTSWSMTTGRRQALSKAVVLACVAQAHQQGRDCQVVAFSTERGTMESGILTPAVKSSSSSSSKDHDNGGIPRLLDFLSHSFGGGTDVTGALKFAMTSLQDELVLASSDILLVTDGEIADPPVSPEIMEQLDTYRLKLGTQIHGLLIGKKESKPLSRICTATHDFLSQYDSPGFTSTVPGGSVSTRMGSARSLLAQRQRPTSTALFAKRKRSKRDEEDDDSSYTGAYNGDSRGGQYMVQVEEDDEEDETDYLPRDTFGGQIIQKVKELQESANERISTQMWSAAELEKELTEDGSLVGSVHQQLREAIRRVEDGLVERSEDARLVVLAMITGEHILLLGSPGTAKSVLGQRLAELCNGIFFQRLLTRFTTPEELFGPLSLKSLEQDEYRRCTAGFLPTADIAFLDEIFKANSAILNTLLTILNERKFDNAGGRETCPIRCVVGASNELPESDDLVALFDRFLIRKEVSPVSDEGVLTLLELSNPGSPSCRPTGDRDDNDECEVVFTDGLDEVIERLNTASMSVVMDRDCAELMRDLRIFLRQELKVQVSDRRLVKASRLLRIYAASNGRSRVDPIDFFVLQHCFWNVPEERIPIRDWLWDHLTPESSSSIAQIRFLLESLRTEIVAVVQKTSGDVSGQAGARPDDLATLHSLQGELKGIQGILEQRLNRLLRHMELIRQAGDSLWLDATDASAMRQLLLPKSESVLSELRRASIDAQTLEAALSPSALSDDMRVEMLRSLWEEGYGGEVGFTEEEMSLSMREAKAKYDIDTFRQWKRAKKRIQ